MYIFKKQDVTKTQTLTQNKRRLLICVSVLFNILLFQVFFLSYRRNICALSFYCTLSNFFHCSFFFLSYFFSCLSA